MEKKNRCNRMESRPSIYIASALLPAKIMAVDIKEEDNLHGHSSR